MENSKRLTAKRCNGIKDGYWSMARKEELVQRLGRFEDIIDTPEKLIDTLKAYDNTVQLRARISRCLTALRLLGLISHRRCSFVML